MKNSNTILASVQAFMDKMQDGDMRELVANLQAALEYKNEELRIYREKFEAETEGKFLEFMPFVHRGWNMGAGNRYGVVQEADRGQVQQRRPRTEKAWTTVRFF